MGKIRPNSVTQEDDGDKTLGEFSFEAGDLMEVVFIFPNTVPPGTAHQTGPVVVTSQQPQRPHAFPERNDNNRFRRSRDENDGMNNRGRPLPSPRDNIRGREIPVGGMRRGDRDRW
jgi:hypothetical protein